MEDYKKILQIEVHNIVDRLQNGLIHPYTAKQEIFNSTLKAINYTHCCEEFADGKCRPMVNADWTYLRCECGKRFKPKG
jgi:hypothetical protein